jgi:UDP-N-acetylglucosamine 4,6-dehydratase/5-epimerase
LTPKRVEAETRIQVATNMTEIKFAYHKDAFLGKRVLVTGGTGFIGSALIRELLNNTGAESICSMSRRWVDSENLARELDDSRFYFVNGDIRDRDFVNRVVRDGSFDLIIHTAAYKSVPSGQTNPEECVTTNVKGSINIANAAKNHGVRAVVGISSDKACEPINVYGQSKAIMEQAFLNAVTDKTNFVICRYGNVVGSTGSVIPLFIDQIFSENRILTVTDLQMTRFWFSQQNAVNFVLSCADGAMGGFFREAIIVPDLPSTTIGTLISYLQTKVARLVDPDETAIKTIGKRSGEKIHELMIGKNEDTRNILVTFAIGFVRPVSQTVFEDGFSSEDSTIDDFDKIDAVLGDYVEQYVSNKV